MADVSHWQGRRSQADRGQLLLVTALGLAILFVSLALIVNTAIYTENLATRSSDIGGGTDAVRFHDATRDSVGGTIQYVNYHNNTSFGDLETELDEGVSVYRNVSGRQFALSDRAVDVRLDASTRGTRIVQTDESRDFTNASGDPAADPWPVAASVDHTREFKMNVTDQNLLDTGAVLGDRFFVRVDDGPNEWTMYVYEDTAGSDIIIEVENASGGGGTCRAAAADSVWINLSAGTIGGEDCQYLEFAEGVVGSYDITYHNPDRISGTYTLIVDNPNFSPPSPGPHLNSPGGGQPFATHAIYSATIDIVYQTPRLRYETTVRVAPGEPE